MIILFTDFGADDLYVGQVHAVLAEAAPGVRVIDLLHNAPAFDVRAGAYLLCALQQRFPVGSVFMAVVDPGVGGERAALMVEAGGKWFVGPDNGLLSRVMAAAGAYTAYEVLWRPQDLSESFHGRDLFAPVAAMLATGSMPEHRPARPLPPRWEGELDRIVYIDHYGNALTGRSGESISAGAKLLLRDRTVAHSRVFCDNPSGDLFWYVNSIGLVEIAANRGAAAHLLGLEIGAEFTVQEGARTEPG